MYRSRIAPALVAGALLSLSPRLGSAQEVQAVAPPCTYERCALRLENANPMFPGRLVQGVEGRPVATIGFFAPRIPVLESSADSIRIPYQSFRSRQRTTSVLAVLSLATLAAAVPLAGHSIRGPSSAMWWALGAGTTLGVATLASGVGAENKLDEAIARYNDQLPDRR